MKRKRRSIYDVVEYTPEQIRFHEWRNKRMNELGLLGDVYNLQIKKEENKGKDDRVKLILELEGLENKAMEYLNNYQEVPDEIKNRIFELRKILKR